MIFIAGLVTLREKNILTSSLYLVPYSVWLKYMNLSNDIKPVTYLKSHAAELLGQINETHRPVIITQNGEPRAVLQDPKSYEEMQNAISMLKIISLGEAEIKNNEMSRQSDVFRNIDDLLKSKMK